MRLKSIQMDLKIQENSVISEGPGGHFSRSEASWVPFALPEGLGAVSGAVLGGSWALLGAVLGRLGRQLGANLSPREHQKSIENSIKSGPKKVLEAAPGGSRRLLEANTTPECRHSVF